jgi:phosphopantothenoylcysteine decarboxylase/phosphopantothenate--cysteine ligase
VRFVVTAGPTREPLDPVRFISNRSSGKMGYAIAEAAIADGDDVTLISGPVCLEPPRDARIVRITTSDELHDAVREATRDCDVLVMCAAVADYKPTNFNAQKSEKQRAKFSIELQPTTDILASIASADRNFFVVGFAAETHDIEERALKKLRAKNCDMIVANDVSRSDSGMESDENEVVIFTRDGESQRIVRAQKKIIARELVKKICAEAKKVLTKKS